MRSGVARISVEETENSDSRGLKGGGVLREGSEYDSQTHICRTYVVIVHWEMTHAPVITFRTKKQSSRNKSGKSQPIRAKFGVRRQVQG